MNLASAEFRRFPRRSLRCGATFLFSLLALPACSTVTFQKLVPIATDQEVRIGLEARSDRPEPVEFLGRISLAADGSHAPDREPSGKTPTTPAEILWEGKLGTAVLTSGAVTLQKTVGNLRPRLWSPGSPALYTLTVTARQSGSPEISHAVRFGFRLVTSASGQVHLNGKPIFLKGIAINPPGRDVPDKVGYSAEFARDYVRYLRSRNVNLIRMNFIFEPDPRQQVWFDACDEYGMMVYQGNYGGPPGGGKKGPAIDPEEQLNLFLGKEPNAPRTAKSAPPEDFEGSVAAYKETFETYARHPSVIIYILSNELPGPVGSTPEWHEYLTRVHGRIREWDPTRLVIGNAGYGLGREGDITDIHRYWGWYYNSFLTYYNLRDTVALFGEETRNQPFTFSECVGSFTSPLGTFNAIYRKQVAPQLGWTGHSENQREDALEYQSFMVKRALESFRTMRSQNPRLAGLMPFTILFYYWEGIKSFQEMKPKPALSQMAVSYSPVLTSIELWTPQVYAGSTIRPRVHVVNDREDFSALEGARLRLELRPGRGKKLPGEDPPVDEAAGDVISSVTLPLPRIRYFEARAFPLEFPVPSTAEGECRLVATLERDGEVLSQNEENLFIAIPRPALARPETRDSLPIYDPSGKTLAALRRLGINVTGVERLEKLPAGARHLVIGQNAFVTSTPLPMLKEFVSGGGRVLCLAQDAKTFDVGWLPAQIQMLEGTATDPHYPPRTRPTADQQNVNPERPWHPVFRNVSRERLRLWSDYTDWNQSKPGFPKVFPVTHGFKLFAAEDLSRVAILADYDRGLEGIALAELFDGKGSVLLTALDLIPRAGLDPVADQMLLNLAEYLVSAEHELHPLVEKPIVWGDYSTERGVLTGPIQGLMYNCRWVPPPNAPGAKPLPDNTGAWNTQPGNPFVPRGVRPFGPYGYSTGASPRQLSRARIGNGVFYCRIPPGRNTVLSKIDNPTTETLPMAVGVNQGLAVMGQIPPRQQVLLRTPLPEDATSVSVHYTGDKSLVVLETSFE